MKRSVIVVIVSSMLLCSCGGTLTGTFMGGALGGAIGGVTGGYHGHDVGVLVGMAAGAAVGASVDAAETSRKRQLSRADDMYMHQQGGTSRHDREYQQHRDAYAQYYYQKNAQKHSFKLEKSDSDKMVRPEDMIDTTNSGNDVISME